MYEPSRQVATFHIAGFQFWDGALAIDELKAGMKLKLVPERDNPHDPDAMALYRKKLKLGFVPAEQNSLASQLEFFGHKDIFEARIIQVDKKADPWHQVRVGLFVNDVRKTK